MRLMVALKINSSNAYMNLENQLGKINWTAPVLVDKFCPHDEACSKASGLMPPSPVVEHFNVIEDIRPGQIPGFLQSAG